MTDNAHPYTDLPPHRFWKSGVADHTPRTIENLYERKFEIAKTDRVATAGSCFAQHVARHMKARGFSILDVEPPVPGMTEETAQRFGYGIYSARYANIYTVRQLRQLVEDAINLQTCGDDATSKARTLRDEDVMERDGRYFDGLRPNVEPEGFATPEEVKKSREAHLNRVYEMFTSMDVFVFTLGLTETWRNRRTGTVYPVCPGVLAGTYSDEVYQFYNMTHADCLADFEAVRAHLRSINPALKTLITVSPVPLTATASEDHVLTATTYSKSVLRGVCGELSATHDDVDYFPSYELITAPFARGRFFAENMRSVTERGVANVMRVFFAAHDPDGARKGAAATAKPKPARKGGAGAGKRAGKTALDREARIAARKAERKSRRQAEQVEADTDNDDLVCEEELLDAFRK